MNRLLRLNLIRHGETNLNFKKVCQGHTDGKLTELGINQAISLGKAQSDAKYDLIFSSDLSRAVDTCSNILKNNKSFNDSITEHQKLRIIRERYYGDADGVLLVEDYLSEAKRLGIPLREHQPAENAETVDQMKIRIQEFIDVFVSQSKNLEKVSVEILIVSHAIFLKEFLRYVQEKYGPIKNSTKKEFPLNLEGILRNTSRTVLELDVQGDDILNVEALVYDDISHYDNL